MYKIYRKLIVCLLPLFIIYNYSIKVNGIENDNILNVTQTINDNKLLIVMNGSDLNYKNLLFEYLEDYDIKNIYELTKNVKEKSQIKNDIFEIVFDESFVDNIEVVKKDLISHSEIKSAEVNGIIELDYEPYCAKSDPDSNRYVEQWGLHGYYGIYAEEAWDLAVQESIVRVGIMDTGLDAHMEFINDIASEGGDFVNMKNIEKNIPGPLREDPTDHGTHVAGIIASSGELDDGISGVAPGVKLIPLQVSYKYISDGNEKWGFDVSAITRAILWADENEVDIINFSGGSLTESETIKYAISQFDGLFIASSGNGNYSSNPELNQIDDVGDDNDLHPYYPSKYSYGEEFSDRVISVGAINKSGKMTTFSNYGKNSVTLFAPGTEIISTINTNEYTSFSGTSMATPFVTGVASLLWGMLDVNNEYAIDELAVLIKKIIVKNVDNRNSLINDRCSSGGTLNAHKAISSIAFSTENISDGLKIVGFNDIINMELKVSLTIPSSFCPIDSLESTQKNVLYVHNLLFKNCLNLKNANLPSSILEIGDSAFENCINLETIELPAQLKLLGDSVFKGCTKLKEVKTYGFLERIGSNAFENCTSLEEIMIPISLTSIGDCAFKNCTNLEKVYVYRRVSNITELGYGVFSGCTSLSTIEVPSSRILEYKNAPNWKVYQSKITSNAVFEEVDINCYSNLTETLDVNKGENAILKINVECSKSYKITASSTDYYIIFKLYDSNMQEINVSPTMSNNECTGVITYTLSKGVYYVSVKYTADAFDGTASINIQLSWTNNNYFGYETSNVLTHLHYVDGELINHSIYTNNYGRGLYKVSINGNLQSYQNVLTIYDNVNKLEPMKRIETSLYELDAVTSMVSNNLVVYLQEGQNYYIDIVVPNGTYSSLTISIEMIEAPIEIDFLNNSETVTVMYNSIEVGDRFVKLEVLESSSISIEYEYIGAQPEFIYFVLFKEVQVLGENRYELQLVFPEMMVTYGESLEWHSGLTSGTYYIGYFNNFNSSNTITIYIGK